MRIATVKSCAGGLSMNDQLSLVPAHPASNCTGVQQRIILYLGELYRVPASYRKLRVVAGTAFVTQAALDLVLGPGHEARLDHKADCALVSPLRSNQLILELCE
jgi:hypothetical protein